MLRCGRLQSDIVVVTLRRMSALVIMMFGLPHIFGADSIKTAAAIALPAIIISCSYNIWTQQQ